MNLQSLVPTSRLICLQQRGNVCRPGLPCSLNLGLGCFHQKKSLSLNSFYTRVKLKTLYGLRVAQLYRLKTSYMPYLQEDIGYFG